MKYMVVLLAVSISLGMVGCKPDLTVESLDITWDETEKSAMAEISNIGNADAGKFLVYFNPEEDPVSSNHRPQVSVPVPSLAKGVTITINADFEPLAHPDNDSLANVFKVVVIADPKNMVEESNEANNEMEQPLP
jgi:hypothetical protein